MEGWKLLAGGPFFWYILAMDPYSLYSIEKRDDTVRVDPQWCANKGLKQRCNGVPIRLLKQRCLDTVTQDNVAAVSVSATDRAAHRGEISPGRPGLQPPVSRVPRSHGTRARADTRPNQQLC